MRGSCLYVAWRGWTRRVAAAKPLNNQGSAKDSHTRFTPGNRSIESPRVLYCLFASGNLQRSTVSASRGASAHRACVTLGSRDAPFSASTETVPTFLPHDLTASCMSRGLFKEPNARETGPRVHKSTHAWRQGDNRSPPGSEGLPSVPAKVPEELVPSSLHPVRASFCRIS